MIRLTLSWSKNTGTLPGSQENSHAFAPREHLAIYFVLVPFAKAAVKDRKGIRFLSEYIVSVNATRSIIVPDCFSAEFPVSRNRITVAHSLTL